MKIGVTYIKVTVGCDGRRLILKTLLGLACFCIGKMGFRSLGLGFESEKKKPKWEWDWCFVSISEGSGHWLVGFGKKWWLGNGIGNPPSQPSLKPFH